MLPLIRTVGGYALLFVCACIASAAGIGGGGLNVPVLLVILQFDYSEAVVLSLCAVLGNTLCQFSINVNRTHPINPKRPLINWEAILVLLPAQIGGSSIGVILALLLPETLLVVTSLIVLSSVSIKTVYQGISLYQSESKHIASLLHNRGVYDVLLSESNDDHSSEEGESPVGTVDYYNEEVESNLPLNEPTPAFGEYYSICAAKSRGISDMSDPIVTKANIDYPVCIIRIIMLVWMAYAAVYTVAKYLPGCSVVYFGAMVSVYPIFIGIIWWGIRHNRYIQKENPQDMLLQGDIDFSKVGGMLPAVAYIVGIMCSLLGIGGGELMGPVLLHFKALPQVSSATTSVMSLFVSSSNIVHYALMGEIPVKTFGIVFAIGLVGGGIGRVSALHISAVTGRHSSLIFTLCLILVLSVGLLALHLVKEELDLKIHGIC